MKRGKGLGSIKAGKAPKAHGANLTAGKQRQSAPMKTAEKVLKQAKRETAS